MSSCQHILLLGLGEVGSALAAGLMQATAAGTHQGLQLRAWDWQFVATHQQVEGRLGEQFQDTHQPGQVEDTHQLAQIEVTHRSERQIAPVEDTHDYEPIEHLLELLEDFHSKPLKNAAKFPGLQLAGSAATAAKGCDLIISAVTAAQDLAAAESVLAGLRAGCWFLDLNSVSPGTKQAVAEAVGQVGGRYLEAAVLSPIAPLGMASPILLGGPHASEFLPIAHALGFSGMRFCSERIGQAAATKMCRSVVVKGMEALLTEATLAARHYGVETQVLESLRNLLSRESWTEQTRYMISRSIEHGARRAEEMHEATLTVAEAGIEPWMSEACVLRQAWAPQFANALKQTDLGALLDSILTQRAHSNQWPKQTTKTNQAREHNSA